MTPLQKLPKNVGDLGKLIVAKGFKKLPKVQKIAQSGHTAEDKGASITQKLSPAKKFIFRCITENKIKTDLQVGRSLSLLTDETN